MPELDEARAAYRIHGRVQGVGFRYWVHEQAKRLEIRGSVRNLSDGSVETALAGSTEAVKQMSQLLHSGPSLARVDRVEEISSPEDLPDEFLILYDEI